MNKRQETKAMPTVETLPALSPTSIVDRNFEVAAERLGLTDEQRKLLRYQRQ